MFVKGWNCLQRELKKQQVQHPQGPKKYFCPAPCKRLLSPRLILQTMKTVVKEKFKKLTVLVSLAQTLTSSVLVLLMRLQMKLWYKYCCILTLLVSCVAAKLVGACFIFVALITYGRHCYLNGSYFLPKTRELFH